MAAILIKVSLHQSPVVGLVMLRGAPKGLPSDSSFVVKAYVKWLEQVNIRWIPLFIEDNETDFNLKMTLIDGIFLTGGAEPLFALNN